MAIKTVNKNERLANKKALQVLPKGLTSVKDIFLENVAGTSQLAPSPRIERGEDIGSEESIFQQEVQSHLKSIVGVVGTTVSPLVIRAYPFIGSGVFPME